MRPFRMKCDSKISISGTSTVRKLVMFALIVFCAFFVSTKIWRMAIAIADIALPGFNYPGRSVTPIFFWWNTFPTDFLRIAKNWKSLKKLKKVWIFCKMHRAFWKAKVLKTLTTFGIIYAADPLVENMTKNHDICLRWLAFDLFISKPL